MKRGDEQITLFSDVPCIVTMQDGIKRNAVVAIALTAILRYLDNGVYVSVELIPGHTSWIHGACRDRETAVAKAQEIADSIAAKLETRDLNALVETGKPISGEFGIGSGVVMPSKAWNDNLETARSATVQPILPGDEGSAR